MAFVSLSVWGSEFRVSILDLDAVSLQEVSIGLLLRIAHLQLVILDELPLAEVHQEHAAWTQASFKPSCCPLGRSQASKSFNLPN